MCLSIYTRNNIHRSTLSMSQRGKKGECKNTVVIPKLYRNHNTHHPYLTEKKITSKLACSKRKKKIETNTYTHLYTFKLKCRGPHNIKV